MIADRARRDIAIITAQNCLLGDQTSCTFARPKKAISYQLFTDLRQSCFSTLFPKADNAVVEAVGTLPEFTSKIIRESGQHRIGDGFQQDCVARVLEVVVEVLRQPGRRAYVALRPKGDVPSRVIRKSVVRDREKITFTIPQRRGEIV